MATHEYLTVEEHGPVRLVTLNRPEAFNAADEALHGELATVWPSSRPTATLAPRRSPAPAGRSAVGATSISSSG